MSHIWLMENVYNLCHSSDLWFKLMFCLFNFWLLVSNKQNTNLKLKHCWICWTWLDCFLSSKRSSVFDHILCFKTDDDNDINHRQYHWFDMEFDIFNILDIFEIFDIFDIFDILYINISMWRVTITWFSIAVLRYFRY